MRSDPALFRQEWLSLEAQHDQEQQQEWDLSSELCIGLFLACGVACVVAGCVIWWDWWHQR